MDETHRNGDVAEISEKLEKSLCMDADDRMETYHRFTQEAKDAVRQGDLSKALELFRLAYNIHQSQKLENRIQKIEEILAQNESEDEEEEFVNVNNSGFMLFKDLYEKLYDYQRSGVAFMYSLYRDGRKGGILADDMGLGKTIQVISFLSGMYDSELISHTLLVMPTSLITNWTKEFAKWTPGMRVKEFHGISKGERTRNLERVQRRGGVIITTYTMLINNWQQLSTYNGKEFTWDYMILDEAHKIKTATTKTAKSACAIPSKNRVLLTGTPVQNNLREMWALFDFACQGALLGTAKTFKTEYENPITRARERDATPGEKALGCRMSENLMAIIKPYFLRRTKAEVQKNKTNGEEQFSGEVPAEGKETGASIPTLTRKNDLIVWTYLSGAQEDIYRQFISLDHIKELLMTSRSPLAELTILKKLCDHPRLLSARAIAALGLEENQQADDGANIHSIANIPDDTLIAESGKLVFLFALLERLRQEGHRTLVFAHYRMVLDIIERILRNRGFKVVRLDGTITHIAERERLITLFQTDHTYSVFLLTTQVGGVGITLTAADRVVIYDPSWNPATDAQAVDRAYRIGQTENVVIYRLITCGTVEEKIYRRQVFKDSLIRQNTGDKKNPFRYFSKQELKELFTLEDTRSSSTQLQLQALHSRHRRTDPELDEHIAHLHAMEMFGISDHDLMFSLEVDHDEAPDNQEEHHYIEGRVQKAQELMKAESELHMQLASSMASSTEAAWLRQPTGSDRKRSQENTAQRSSPPVPQDVKNFNGSPVVVDLDQSSSSKEGDRQSNGTTIDLTADDDATEDKPSGDEDIPKEPNPDALKQETEDESDQDQTWSDAPLAPEGPEASADDDGQLGEPSPSKMGFLHVTPLQNKRLSILQSSASFKAGSSSKVSDGLESFEGNFNLQLEDSEVSLDQEENQLLSRLQLDGSFDVNRSLTERHHEQNPDDSPASRTDESDDESFINVKKKRGVIYDSEEEEEEEEEEEDNNNRRKTPSDSSFQMIGASTPISGSTPRQRLRKSTGGNTSVASRRSLLQSIIEDLDHQGRENGGDDGGDGDSWADKAEEDLIGPSHDESQLEEELDTEGQEEEDYMEVAEEEEEDDDNDGGGEEEEEEEDDDDDNSDEEEEEEETSDPAESGEQESSNLEESTNDPELASSEQVDQCTAVKCPSESECNSYDVLVCRGRECFSQGRLDDALDFFLRAIDIKPGDPEIQLMTIQLYRQLSQKK